MVKAVNKTTKNTESSSSARARLISAGTELFAEKGFNGAAVRAICAQADTSMNMIHHYFGNKEGLFNAIMEQFSQDVFNAPNQVIAKPVRSKEDFISRFEIYLEQTLDALIANHKVYLIIAQQPSPPPALAKCISGFAQFLQTAAEHGYLNPKLDWEMITGFVIERLTTQIRLIHFNKDATGPNIIHDKAYRARWLAANQELFLHGLMG